MFPIIILSCLYRCKNQYIIWIPSFIIDCLPSNKAFVYYIFVFEQIRDCTLTNRSQCSVSTRNECLIRTNRDCFRRSNACTFNGGRCQWRSLACHFATNFASRNWLSIKMTKDCARFFIVRWIIIVKIVSRHELKYVYNNK